MALFMYRNSKLLCAFAFCISVVIANAFSTEIPISKKLTLSEVMALGFRPSNLTPYDMGPVRCWDRQDIILSFKDGYHYSIKAESITFNVYDDDQIASIEIYGDSDYPITLDRAVKETKAFYGRFGPVPEAFEIWVLDVYRANMFESFGHVVKVQDGVRAGIQLLPTLQRINQKPTLLGIVVKWEYLGTGPLGGSRSKPVVTPPGYDWDMSYEAWSKRIIEKGSQKPKAKSPDDKADGHEGAIDLEQEKAKDLSIAKKTEKFPPVAVSEGNNSSWFKWLTLVLIVIIGAFFAKWVRSRNSTKPPNEPH